MSTVLRRPIVSALAALVFVAVGFASHGSRAAVASPADLPLPVFGFPSGATITGTNPRFDLYVPDYRGARKMNVKLVLKFPPHVDGNSVVVVRVDGAPLASTTVAALRKGGTADATFAGFRGTGRMLDVSVETYLTVSGRSCEEYDPRSLWMYVAPLSSIRIERSSAPPTSVAEFFEDYDGRYAVTVAPGSSDEVARGAVALGYWLNQLQRWRRVHLTFLEPPAGAARNIVVGNATGDLALRDGVLYATLHGIDLIAARAARAIVSDSTTGTANIKGKIIRSPVTLEKLGIGTRTQKGAGQLSFPVDFSLGTFGDLPRGLRLRMELSHGPYHAGDRASVTVLLNGAVVNGFTLSQTGKTEYFEVPIDENRLGGANALSVVVEFIPSRQECAGGRPSITVSLLGTSSFSWEGTSDYQPTIGEFFNEASGHAEVAISDPKLERYAFTILDRLGTIDPNLSRLTVRRYDAPAGDKVKEAIYVAAPEVLSGIPIAYDPASGKLLLKNGSEQPVYEASLDSPYGLIQTLRSEIPTLVVTYAKSPSALDSLVVAPAHELSGARYDVLLFNNLGIAYTNPGEILANKRKPPTPIRAAWPLIAFFVLVVVIALVLIARRARRVS
jgi:hypothetical protein